MRWRNMYVAATLSAIALSAAACERPTPISSIVVPTLRDYSPAFQIRLRHELKAAPAAAIWPDVIDDYAELRVGICALRPDQPACERICRADPGKHQWCPP